MPPESTVDELDLSLIHALQMSPRAPWTDLAAVLQVDPATLARRWRRLVTSGSAWVTCYPAGGRGCLALVEVDIAPAHLHDVTARLAADPHAATVERLTGNRDLLVTVGAPDPASLTHYIHDRLSTLPGVTSLRPNLVTRIYAEGSGWRLRSLDPTQRRSLAAPTTDDSARAHALTPADVTLMAALGADARLPITDLAHLLDVSPTTATRRLARLLSSAHARLRCEVAHSLSGWPVSATFWLGVPPPELDATAQELSVHGEVRLCAAVTGAANLCVVTWLRSIGDVPSWEASLTRRFPTVAVLDRAVTLEASKRVGRLLTPEGRSTGYVPLLP